MEIFKDIFPHKGLSDASKKSLSQKTVITITSQYSVITLQPAEH